MNKSINTRHTLTHGPNLFKIKYFIIIILTINDQKTYLFYSRKLEKPLD